MSAQLGADGDDLPKKRFWTSFAGDALDLYLVCR
jgi:hypothetical protein